jgi:hypothetical protein
MRRSYTQLKLQRRTKGKVTRIIFRQSQGLWALEHSRKIPAVAVATDNTKPHLPPMDCPDQKIGAIANSQRRVWSKRLYLSNWLAFFSRPYRTVRSGGGDFFWPPKKSYKRKRYSKRKIPIYRNVFNSITLLMSIPCKNTVVNHKFYLTTLTYY